MSDTQGSDRNLPMTGSAPRQELRSTYSDRLTPATNEQFRNELTACLVLVAPVGMAEEARRDWFRVAWATLGHLPADILANACKVARSKADHPAKIVPAILEAAEQSMRWRKEAAQAERRPERLIAPSYCTAAEAASILKEYGIK